MGDVQNGRIAIVCSRFNEHVTKALFQGAIKTLKEHGVDDGSLLVAWVPGAFELPLAALQCARKKSVTAVICLGAVIRGDTPHFDFVAAAAAEGIMRVGLDTGKPVIFGVLTTDTVEQAFERAGGIVGHKGAEAAEAALQMMRVNQQIQEDAQ